MISTIKPHPNRIETEKKKTKKKKKKKRFFRVTYEKRLKTSGKKKGFFFTLLSVSQYLKRQKHVYIHTDTHTRTRAFIYIYTRTHKVTLNTRCIFDNFSEYQDKNIQSLPLIKTSNIVNTLDRTFLIIFLQTEPKICRFTYHSRMNIKKDFVCVFKNHVSKKYCCIYSYIGGGYEQKNRFINIRRKMFT